MSSEPSVPELTTRDVLLQVDRRMTLMEGDLRTLGGKTEEGFRTQDAKIEALGTGLRQEIRANTRDLRQELNTRFYWMIGILLASWFSTMGTILLKQ